MLSVNYYNQIIFLFKYYFYYKIKQMASICVNKSCYSGLYACSLWIPKARLIIDEIFKQFSDSPHELTCDVW